MGKNKTLQKIKESLKAIEEGKYESFDLIEDIIGYLNDRDKSNTSRKLYKPPKEDPRKND